MHVEESESDFHGVCSLFSNCPAKKVTHTYTQREKEAKHSQVSSLEEECMHVHCTALLTFLKMCKFSWQSLWIEKKGPWVDQLATPGSWNPVLPATLMSSPSFAVWSCGAGEDTKTSWTSALASVQGVQGQDLLASRAVGRLRQRAYSVGPVTSSSSGKGGDYCYYYDYCS